jgi:hypothetical protein
MNALTTNFWKTGAALAVWAMVFLALLLGGYTFNAVEDFLSRTIGIGLIFFAIIFTTLVWFSKEGSPGATPAFHKVVGWTACFILGLAVGMAGLLILSEQTFHQLMGIWTNQGIVFISLLLAPAIVLGFFTRHTPAGKFAFIGGSVAACIWLLFVGWVLLGFLLEPSRASPVGIGPTLPEPPPPAPPTTPIR